MRLTDLKVLGGFCAVDLLVVKLLENVLEKGAGQAFGQLFFSQFRMESECPLVEELRRPPQPLDQGTVPQAKTLFSF